MCPSREMLEKLEFVTEPASEPKDEVARLNVVIVDWPPLITAMLLSTNCTSWKAWPAMLKVPTAPVVVSTR